MSTAEVTIAKILRASLAGGVLRLECGCYCKLIRNRASYKCVFIEDAFSCSKDEKHQLGQYTISQHSAVRIVPRDEYLFRTYNPGSLGALARGCSCRRKTNEGGRGVAHLESQQGESVFLVSGQCEMHGRHHGDDETRAKRAHERFTLQRLTQDLQPCATTDLRLKPEPATEPARSSSGTTKAGDATGAASG